MEHIKQPNWQKQAIVVSLQISTNSKASQLVKNGIYEVKDHASTGLVNNKMTDLKTKPTLSSKQITEDFIPDKLACALQHLLPEKAVGPNFVGPE